MGNHHAGRMIVTLAETMVQNRGDKSAMDILDAAVAKAKSSGGYSPDTEFDDAPYEDGPFRTLLIEAFGNGDRFDEDEDGDRFFDVCYWPFKQRHGMC